MRVALTRAQQTRQNNRDTAGRYAPTQRGEADSVVLDQRASGSVATAGADDAQRRLFRLSHTETLHEFRRAEEAYLDAVKSGSGSKVAARRLDLRRAAHRHGGTEQGRADLLVSCLPQVESQMDSLVHAAHQRRERIAEHVSVGLGQGARPVPLAQVRRDFGPGTEVTIELLAQSPRSAGPAEPRTITKQTAHTMSTRHSATPHGREHDVAWYGCKAVVDTHGNTIISNRHGEPWFVLRRA